MSAEEWGAAPWYYTEALKEGLRAEGVLKSAEDPGFTSTGGTPQPGGVRKAPSVDLTDGTAIPRGFKHRTAPLKTRRAG